MSRLTLKIKRITLAAEARGIRINENRLRRKLRRLNQKGKESYHVYVAAHSLRDHRLTIVRQEARAAHLAEAFLAQRIYGAVEAISYWHGFNEHRVMMDMAAFNKQWDALWERVRYHVEKHLTATGEERSKRLQEFAAWHDAAKEYVLDNDTYARALGHAQQLTSIARAQSRARITAEQRAEWAAKKRA